MSFIYTLSVKHLLLFFRTLHAKDSGPSCPIMMPNNQTNTVIQSVECSPTNVPESIIELKERHYIMT